MKKIILFLLGAVFCLGLSANRAKADDGQPGNIIYYEKGGYIWQLDISSDMKYRLFKGHMPKLSPDGTMLAYYNKNMKPAIYNVTTENKRVLYKYKMETANMQPTWSPSGKYLVVNRHTSTNNTYVVINMAGKKRAKFNAVSKVYWLSDKELVYSSLHSLNILRPRGTGGGDGFGITRVNVKTKKSKRLMLPTDLIDYQLFDVMGGKIRYIKSIASSQDDWTNSNVQTSYWKMNRKGGNIEEIGQLISWEEKIAAILPSKYNNYIVTDYGAYLETKWRLFTMSKDYNTTSEIVYIIHYPHKNTLSKIVKGDFPTW